jgi:hypothetical protein
MLVAAAVACAVHLARARQNDSSRARRPATAEVVGPCAPATPAFAPLLEKLRHGTTLDRAQAARDLRKLGPLAAPAIPDLVSFLQDPDERWERLRDLIESVLVAMGEEAVPAALELIASPDAGMRCHGIRILARIRGEAAAPTLAALLKERGGKCAADQLARTAAGRDALVVAVADGSVPLKTIAEGIADAGKPMALPLAALLDARDPGTRERAARMLEKLGKNARPATDAILRALADQAFGDRLPLVEILSSLERLPPGIVPVLASLARDLVSTKAAVNLAAARAAGNKVPLLGDRNRELAPLRAIADLGPAAREALPDLVAIMKAGDLDAGAAAALAHWRVSGDPEVAVGYLVQSLSRDFDGSHPSLWVLQEMGADAKAAIPALLRELESPSGLRAMAAGSALKAMGNAALPALREWLPTGNPTLVSGLLMQFGDELKDELIARFGDEAREETEFVDWFSSHPALAVAGVEGDVDSFPELRDKLERDDPVPRLLLKLHEPKAEDPPLVFMALRSLGEKAAPAVPDLVELLTDDKLRAEAARTLGAIGPAAEAAVPALEPYVDDPWWEGRDAAIQALYRITGDTRYRDLAYRPDEVRPGDDWALPFLLKDLDSRSPTWRKDAVEALGRLGVAARDAVPSLARLATDPKEDEYVRDAAREALQRIG